MAQSGFATRQWSSDAFVESCGAVLFDLRSEVKVCLLRYRKKDEWLLAKGRRNERESRADAALREVMEETGYRCSLLPVTMQTRAPAQTDAFDTPDRVRTATKCTEPFMVTMREIDGGSRAKFIWWFIAAIDDNCNESRSQGEADNESHFFGTEEALQKLTYQADREVLHKAIELVI